MLGKQVNKCWKEWTVINLTSVISKTLISHVATRFNTDDHSLSDFSFMPTDIVPHDMEKETCWIHKMGTKFPSGLNAKFMYNIK